MLRFAIVSSFVMILGVAIAAVAAYLVWQSFGAPGPLTDTKTVIIQRGSGVDEIADQLAREGVIANAYAFRIVTRIEGMSSRLKAGEFAFPAGASQRAVAEQMVAGRTVTRHLTIPEGLSTFQVLALIRAAPGMDGEISSTPQEGELLPETYDYHWGDSRERFIQRLRRDMTETLNALWNSRARELPLRGPTDAVILASIVEKETALSAERPRIAAVYLNRLRRGMKLEADPTVIYGITQGRATLDRPLSRADLQQRTQWNTYVVDGLPPTPIANPGRAALQAVLRPAQSDELYFVADGNGGHLFARTLQEHNANVARLRELERQRARAQGQAPDEAPSEQQPQTPQQRRPQQQRRN
jgi:UPF0755 protein